MTELDKTKPTEQQIAAWRKRMGYRKIFPARAYTDYGSLYEKEYIRMVKKEYPVVEIIELPNIEELHEELSIRYGTGLFNKEREHFFPLIDRCDILIVAPIDNEFNKDGSKRSDKGELSEGVMMEILYALSIGKKVYKLKINNIYGNQFEEIRGIYDSEELIEELIDLNRRNLLRDFPKIKALINTEKRFFAHQKMMDLYVKNPKVRELIKGFMNGNRSDIEYVRPIVIQKKYPEFNKPILYIPGTNAHYTLGDMSFDGDKKIMTFKNMDSNVVGEMHFRECIFSPTVKNASVIDKEVQEVIAELTKQGKKIKNYKWRVFDKYILGACLTFDIDAPGSKDHKGKVDMFDNNYDWYEEFMTLKCFIEGFVEKKMKLKCVSFTTGNGFNIVTEPYWFDERGQSFYEFKEEMSNVVAKINEMFSYKLKGVRIDPFPITWSVFKKMPFTYHSFWNRITIPVAKGRIDKEWLKKITDLDYFLNDHEKHVDEVIEKSKWENDKWW